MTDIIWGDPIEVNGVRPEWLADDDKVNPTWNGTSEYGAAVLNNRNLVCLERLTHIRLPSDHPAYLALAKGFVPWGGGDEAPADWSGKAEDILEGDGTEMPEGEKPRWGWIYGGKNGDCIGYRKRTEQPAPAIASLTEREVREIVGGFNAADRMVMQLSIRGQIAADPDIELAKSIAGDVEAIALAIKAARENG